MLMKFLIRLLVAALCFGGAVAQAAGSVSNVTITRIAADSLGHFFFYFSGPIGGTPPGCATVTTGMVVDGTTAGGKVLVSTIMTWYVTSKPVSGTGTGACTLVTGYENASSFTS
jgi:hypothetical protein